MGAMELSLITFNISADFLSPPNVPAWEERKALCAQVLRQANASVIGLQEVMPRQFECFQSQWLEYRAVTVEEAMTDESLLQAIRQQYRVPTFPARNEVVMFYCTADFEPLAQGHWWLSPTPDRISVGFGNIAPRLVLRVQLCHRASGREFIVCNTHLDWRATRPMVELCRAKLAAFSQRGLPLIFMGDFNFSPTEEEFALLTDDGWRDAHAASSATNEATFMDGRRIDHVFYRGVGLRPQRWTCLLSPDPQRRLSDHDPVSVRLRVE